MAATHDTETDNSDEWTTIAARRGTMKRFCDAKPFDTISNDEFVRELLDHYESEPVSE